jgi:glucokinase
VLEDFLSGEPPPAAATLAIAGPILDRAGQITNLSWGVSGPDLAARFALDRVELLNDVEALAWATSALYPSELATLQEGRPDSRGAVAVVALGTGLGMGYLTGGPAALQAHPSEGGHADFAPTTPLLSRLLAGLWREFDHVSVERVASGLGLPRIHRFLVTEEAWTETPAIADALEGAADPTPVIVRAATSGESAACRESVALLCDIVAAEAGNLALKVLATGGVFLGGGMAPRLLPFLRESRFREAFCAKGRFSRMLEQVPFRVILPPEAVLWGAALHGMGMLRSES